MSDPSIELIPGKMAVCSDASIALDVLIRITPPRPEVHFLRSPLNLALVLDHSGSMGGAKKMPYAREAAAFVVRQLLPTDRVSVTVFDHEVETIVQSTLATDKPGIVNRIERVQPRGSTNLHGGWAEGARQAELYRAAGGLNRVLLLSDGLANVGITDPNVIADDARGLAARGVATTTMGVGDDYNEDLMEAVAKAGDGHYYYIESPVQLADILQTELEGLMATQGQKVSLGLEPRAGVGVGVGVVVSDVLNDFEKAATGRLMLPNLIEGMPILVVVRLNIPAQSSSTDLLGVRLAWDAPAPLGGGRRVVYGELRTLPAVPMAAWSQVPVDPVVREQEALLMIARAQKEASHALEQGDLAGSANWLATARTHVANIPASFSIEDELRAIDAIEAALQAGDNPKMTKLAKYRSYLRKWGRSTPPPGQAGPPPIDPPQS
jgi:Ca-activated chloride channel family protein